MDSQETESFKVPSLAVTVPTAVRWARVLAKVGRLIADELEGISQEQAAGIEVAISESIANVIEHAHRHDSSLPVRIEFAYDGGQLTIDVFDRGPGFDISAVPPVALAHLGSDGRGVHIMRGLMDEVSYDRVGTTNRLRLIKRLPAQQ
ncbi:MAG: ATP-binding protein [Chloroflexi bacterium]|nr:ATP-binding protein [Chloroflexota bacterium]